MEADINRDYCLLFTAPVNPLWIDVQYNVCVLGMVFLCIYFQKTWTLKLYIQNYTKAAVLVQF